MKAALLAAVLVAALAGTAAPAPAATVDLTLSCASQVVGGVPNVQVQFAGGYAQSSAWVGFVLSPTGGRQLAQVGVDVPPIYSKGRCRRVATRVSLAPKGLGGPPTLFDVFATCHVSPRFFIRIHATTEGRHVRTAAAVVRTAKGAAVAWAGIGANGKGRLLTSGRCTS